MAIEVTWYLTPISRTNSSDPTWDVVPADSVPNDVWFGTQAEFDALPDPSIYDIAIVDDNDDGLVDADELREALNASTTAPDPSNNAGYLGTDDVDYTLDGQLAPTVAYSTANQGIEATTEGVLIAIDPLDPALTEFEAEYKGGVGNFTPFLPDSLAPPPPPCFTRGTTIATKAGVVAIETLHVGDQVLTMDTGYQEIVWIGARKLDAADLRMNPKWLPIRIKAGALGNGMPKKDLTVSPQHRMLLRSVIAERMFGEKEVLIPAKKLLMLDGVDIVEDAVDVEYFHMLFDRHEIVFANGAPSESLFTGPEALKGLTPDAYEEITTLFPDILLESYSPIPVRYIPAKGKLMKKLVKRHQSNNKPFVQ